MKMCRAYLLSVLSTFVLAYALCAPSDALAQADGQVPGPSLTMQELADDLAIELAAKANLSGATFSGDITVNGSFVSTPQVRSTGDLTLNPNFGSNVVRSRGDIVPNTVGVENLGTASLRWGEVHTVQMLVGTAEIHSGTGTPESAITAPVGSLFLRTDGGANTTLYVKESGAGNTGWIAK